MFRLPELPYLFDALEPYIDARTMELHYLKHHQGYVDKLNEALASYPTLQKLSVEELLKDLPALPEEIRTKVRNQGGGHANHSLFWHFMSGDTEQKPHGELAKTIDQFFGSFEQFKQQFNDAAKNRFGSGWAWLIMNKQGKLEVYSTANQDSPISEMHYPLLGLDVWEHAYYLKYQNRRPEYINAWWQVVNWDYVSQRFAKVK